MVKSKDKNVKRTTFLITNVIVTCFNVIRGYIIGTLELRLL